MLTYAQNFEDVILARLFSEQESGFYIDVGASHPENLSVTKYFYDMGWKGVNIEPIPANSNLFDESRPRDININAAIDTQKGKRTFYEVVAFDALSTFDPKQAEFLRKTGYHLNEYQVETITLNSIFETCIDCDVDFLKIDVEGSEELVIRSLDLEKFRPRVLLIEATLPARGFPGWDNIEKFASWDWERLITDAGYIFAHFDGISRYYLRQEDAALLARFELPIGYFDNIQFAETHNTIYTQKTELKKLEKKIEKLKDQVDTLENELQSTKSANETLEHKLHEATNIGFKGRIDSLLKYSKFRIKKFVHSAIWRVATGPAAPKLPKITVITPVFNGEAYISETIESVLSQNYPIVEYIIVDGNSSDRTLEIIREYQNRSDFPHTIKAVLSEPDNGMYDAIAKGFEMATGDIFCYLNSDDIFEPNALNSVGEHFAKNPKDQVIYHEDVVLVEGWKYPNINQPARLTTSDLLSGHILFQDGVFWRRKAYECIGGVRRDLKLAGDFDLWLRLSARFRLVRRPNHVSCFRVRPGQLSTQMDSYRREMQVSINDFLDTAPKRKRILWSSQRLVLVVLRRIYKTLSRNRLFFPIDFSNMPPPAVIISPEHQPFPKSPIDGRPVERLLFSTPDTRFGESEINYIYLDSRHGITITHPPIASDKLDLLYRKNYSNPPLELICGNGTSPYRAFNGRKMWEKILLRLPIEKAANISNNVWSDNTLIELIEVLKNSKFKTSRNLRFLDTGCFEGSLLDKIRESTLWQGFGLEPNTHAVEIAQAKGHIVWQGHAENAVEVVPDDKQFDVIFMGQSIEHVDDPLKVLRRLRLLLAPGGVIILSTPNLDSREVDWYGPTWAHWHAPYHRYIFSKKGIAAITKAAGLLPVHFQSFSHPYWTAMSIVQNNMGLNSAVSHAIDFPRNVRVRALRISLIKKVFFDHRGKGDYFYQVIRDFAHE